MLLQIALVVLLAALNGFFALSEMALMVARRSRLKHLALTSRRAKVALGLAQEPENFLATVQVFITLLQVGVAPLAAAYYHQPQVAELLRVQALIFLATPFISIPEVLLMRQMDFRRQALVNIGATMISATVALACALAGYGVWTLVYAPIALFWSRAIGLQLVTRARYWPSFR